MHWLFLFSSSSSVWVTSVCLLRAFAFTPLLQNRRSSLFVPGHCTLILNALSSTSSHELTPAPFFFFFCAPTVPVYIMGGGKGSESVRSFHYSMQLWSVHTSILFACFFYFRDPREIPSNSRGTARVSSHCAPEQTAGCFSTAFQRIPSMPAWHVEHTQSTCRVCCKDGWRNDRAANYSAAKHPKCLRQLNVFKWHSRKLIYYLRTQVNVDSLGQLWLGF